MTGILQGSCSGTTLTITTEFGQRVLPNDQEKHNKKSLNIFLRAWHDPISGKPTEPGPLDLLRVFGGAQPSGENAAEHQHRWLGGISFHHDQRVSDHETSPVPVSSAAGGSAWLKRHLPDTPAQTVTLLKRKMKRVVQTCDPRTVIRRLQPLEAQDAQEGWGLTSWLTTVRGKLDRLRPALRRNQYPRTTNQIEPFFRAFQRFYKTRGGFHSAISAQR